MTRNEKTASGGREQPVAVASKKPVSPATSRCYLTVNLFSETPEKECVMAIFDCNLRFSEQRNLATWARPSDLQN